MAEKHLFKRHPLALAVSPLGIFPKLLFLSLCVTGTQAMADPFFSEYVEGSSNSKALEIYNPGPGSLNLAGCQVKMYFNGAITPGLTHTFASGTIPAGGVYVLANPISSSALLNLANGVTSGTGWFNGDDAIELACGGVTKDIIGQIGLDPGTEWGTGLDSTQDNTISRKSTVCAGDTNGANAFIPAAEWTGSAIDTFSGLGSHTASCSAATPTVNLSVSATTGTEAGQTVITLTATASAAVSGDQTINVAVSGTGITATDYALSNTTITIPSGSTTGSVTFTIADDADLEGAETATVTLSNPSAGISVGATSNQNIAITDNDAPVLPSLTINDVSQNEGNNGVTNYVFTVALSAPAGAGGVSFDIATVNGTATTASGDYLSKALSGQTIAAGNSSYTFSVAVNGDVDFEANEAFTVTVSAVSGATVADAQGLATIINDDSGCGTSATKISALQGSGTNSPLAGVAGTTIEGIVVGDYQGTSANSLRGYFVQEEDADADGSAATSEGVFVFEGTAPLAAVNVGDKVRVTGTPAEFFDMTQLGTLTSAFVCASNQAIPTAAQLTLPVPGVPNGNLTTATTAINAYFEKYEGMLVRFPATLSVAEYFQLERYGQLTLSQGGRIPTFSAVTAPSVAAYTNHLISLAKRRIILDDGNNSQNYALTSGLPLPYPTGGLSITNRFRGGDSINQLTGVLHWSFAGQSGTDAWRIRPVEALVDYNFTSANPRKTVAPQVGGTLKVASFNVLNYFTTLDTTSSSTTGPCGPSADQDCRGADSAAELTRQTAKAAAALCGINADIVGLMEIENNATASLSSLVGAANATVGCGPYAYINTGTIGGDAIKVGLLYKTTTVSPVGSHAVLTTAADVRFIDTKNRPSLAQTFAETATGEKFTVAVNHLKSKGSDCNDVADPDALDGQGNCNLTRKNAAMALTDWLNSDPTSSGDPDYLIIGDLNSYAKEDPIKAIENGPDDTANTVDDYTNLVKNFAGVGAYSYVFDGQTGYLDHALANSSLATQVTDTTDWHINSDEPPSFDYNDTVATTGESSFEAKPAALPLYEANAYRTSDHDPVIIGLKLGEYTNLINGTAAKNTLVGTSGKDRITGLGSADLITGGLGNDEFVYTNPTEGIDTLNDFTPGQDKIVLAALLQSLQYQGLDPLADGVVTMEAAGSNTTVYIDTDGTAGPALKRALIVVRNISVATLKNAANFLF